MSWWRRVLRLDDPAQAQAVLMAQELAKAQSLTPSKGKAPLPLAHDLDPHDVFTSAGDEATLGHQHLGTAGLTYSTLAHMSRVPTIGAIIQTRINQVAEFAWPATQDGELGFQIRLRDREAKASKKQQKRAREITDWMLSCGDERIGYELNLEGFLRMLTRDSLTYDQGCFELVRTRGKDLAGFVPVDSSTIRRAVPTEKERKAGQRVKDETVAFVQVVADDVVAEWSARDFVFGVRRPRSNIHVAGYGCPELEDLIRVTTSLLHAETYNANNFTHGMHAAGILALKSKMNPKLFRAFRREFYSMMSGAYNAKKTPIIQLDPDSKEELQAVNLSQSNREMEFKEWMAYLQKIACAIYQIDPAELGFIYGAEGQSGALTQQGPEGRIVASKEKGLRPLLRALQVWLNRGVVSQIDPDYELVFVGLDHARQEAALESDLKKLKAFMTPNEIRSRYDLKPIPKEVDGGTADLILDSSYLNTATQLLQQQQMAEGGEDGEGEPQEGEGEPQEGEGEEQFDMPEDDVDLDALFGGQGGDDEPDEDDEDDEDDEPIKKAVVIEC